MAYISGKWRDMWEMALVFQKRLKHVQNDVDLWEMAQTFGEMA